jgi:AraC-like DNA-binding protein
LGVSIVLVRAFVEVVERAGVNRDELLRPLGVALDASDVRIDFSDFVHLEERALDLTGDEALGLHIGEQASEAAFDLVAHLVSHAPTLREGLDLCLRFQRVFADESELTLTEKGGIATIRLNFPRSTVRADRLHAEFVMAGLVRMIRTFGAPDAAAQTVAFDHARPAYHAEYTRIFGGIERFLRPCPEMTMESRILDRRHLHHDAELFQVLRSQAERKLDRLTRGLGLAERLRQYFMARPPLGGGPDMAAVARDMGMSPRSLRRKLADEGTSYKSVLDEALGAAAALMLKDTRRSIQETAHAMGFSDPTAFHRAFKRWTGMTPKQYREKGEV